MRKEKKVFFPDQGPVLGRWIVSRTNYYMHILQEKILCKPVFPKHQKSGMYFKFAIGNRVVIVYPGYPECTGLPKAPRTCTS